MGPVEWLKGPPVVKANEVPVRRGACCLLLCRQEGPEHTLCLGTLQTLAEKGKTQESPASFQVSGRKHAEHKLIHSLTKTQRSPALFSALFHMYLCINGRQRSSLQTSAPPPCEYRGRYSSRHAGFPEITPILKTQLQLQSNSSLIHAPLHLPEGQTHHGWGLWESSPYAEGKAWAGFARMRFVPQPSAEHVQAERFEMFIKWLILAAKWSESHSPAKSQQHGGARAAPIGYLTVSRQAKLLFSPISRNLVVPVPHQPHAIVTYVHKHTHRAALPLKSLHC